MSFASPFPDVEIPNASVYEYLFGNIADADADRVALVDAKTGDETSYRETVGKIDSFAGALADRGIGVGDVVGLLAPNSTCVRDRLSRHPARRRDGHHDQRVVHGERHRQTVDGLEGHDVDHRQPAAPPGQGGRRCRSACPTNRLVVLDGADGHPSARGPSRCGCHCPGRQLRSSDSPGRAALQLRHDRQSEGRDADAPQPGRQRRPDAPGAGRAMPTTSSSRSCRSSTSTE